MCGSVLLLEQYSAGNAGEVVDADLLAPAEITRVGYTGGRVL